MTSERTSGGRRGASPIARRAAILVVALAVVALAVGCDLGGGEPDPTAAEEREPAGSDDAAERPDEGDQPADDVARRIRDACRDLVDRAPGMPEGVRRDVIAECDEAAADDAEAARTAAGAACEAFAAATAPWPLRGAVADACRRALPDATRL
ncbi:MAG TPA: hypothetical protein VK919_05275 [Solirubrobacterales bacterium]|nr:hypothetical protein [Solirubrobacterales bacterium]